MLYIVVLIIFVVFVSIIWSLNAAKKRREALQTIASSQGLQFNAAHDYSFDEQYYFINKLCEGDNRYAFNIFSGIYQEHPVWAFDYHYETTSTDSDGDQTTHDHYFSFYILHFEANFPELLISREGLFSKFAQFMGFEDIDFESAEFSRRFLVKSPDKKFAYDICHGQMIEYLLDNDDLNIEIERNCLTLFFPRCSRPDQIQPNLNRLVAVRQLFPEYLFQ